MEGPAPTVLIVDDDVKLRRYLGAYLRTKGYRVKDYGSAREYLQDDCRPSGPCCLLLDVCMPDMDGLALQRELSRQDEPLPIVFISGQSGILEAVEAMKAGAVDFLEKPFEMNALRQAIERALRRSYEATAELASRREIEERYASLTAREREVFGLLMKGFRNRQVGEELGISEKTVKIHRARVMDKMGAATVVDLVKMGSSIEFR